jgi:hypothetical protein
VTKDLGCPPNALSGHSRPAGRGALLFGLGNGFALRACSFLVMAWSVDRLRRSLQDLVEFLSELHAAGVDLCEGVRSRKFRPQLSVIRQCRLWG